jgi:hypothetical protein
MTLSSNGLPDSGPSLPAVFRWDGGFFLCRGALETESRVVSCCRFCGHFDRKGSRPSWALTLNDWGQWQCERYVQAPVRSR